MQLIKNQQEIRDSERTPCCLTAAGRKKKPQILCIHNRMNLMANLFRLLLPLCLLLLAGTSRAADLPPGPLALKVIQSSVEGGDAPAAHQHLQVGARQADTDKDGLAIIDGLPAGRHILRIQAPGFATVEQPLDLAAGERPAVEIRLLPALALPAKGRVSVAGTGQPVAGARVRLAPLAVPATFAGPSEAVSDWEGNFEMTAVAPGRYRLHAEIQGFLPLEREVQLAAAAEPLVIELQPETQSAGLDLSVRDAVSGAALTGAVVELAETWPAGRIAEQKTDDAGRVSFRDLQLGLANQPDQEGRVAMAHRRITARASADGYAPAILTVSLGGDAVAMALQPLTLQPETEPNDDLNRAQEVRVSAPIQFKIGRRGDHDHFRFQLAADALLTLEIAASSPLDTHLRLLDDQGRLLREQGVYAKQPNRIERRVKAGMYRVEVLEWGDNSENADQDLTLTIADSPAVDPREPNDTPDAATPIRIFEETSGLIWPEGDQDFFRFQVSRPGIIRLRDLPIDLDRHLRLLDSEGRMLSEQGVYAGQPLDFQYQVAPGNYLLTMGEWGDNGASATPYRLRVDLLADDTIDDPPLADGGGGAVRTLNLPGAAGTTILPRGDLDLYRVVLPGAGRLRVQSEGGIDRHLRLIDNAGHQLAEHGAYAGALNDLSWFVNGPETLFLVLGEWGDNNWSPAAVSLRAWFEPADDFDLLRRNDAFAHAIPILPGDVIRGSYQPAGDRDTFVLDTDFPGFLEVSATAELDTHLRIYDSDQRLLQEQGVYSGQTARLRPEVGKGRYYVLVGEWGDNAALASPYELRVGLVRAEPGESEPLRDDPPRPLADGEARSFAIDQHGDRDRFLFEAPAAGTVHLRIASPLDILARVFDDRTGVLLHESGHYAQQKIALPFELKGPTRLRIELTEWGDNGASLEPGFVMLDTRGRELRADAITRESNPALPRRVSLRRAALPYVAPAGRCDVDLEGDGRTDLQLNGENPSNGELRSAGLYGAEMVCTGPEGQKARSRMWIDAQGARERSGVAVFLSGIGEGQEVREPLEVFAQAVSYEGLPIRRVEHHLDGHPLAVNREPPFRVDIDWTTLNGGGHRLKSTAYDQSGAKATAVRNFTLSDYFGLRPADNATVTGDEIRVSWTGPEFGPAQARFRKKGDDAWQEIRGENGRQRVITLRGLETGVPYEVQPLGGKEAGPLRTVIRVKGLAFGRSRYGANIRRDYDQRVGISVRNNGDAPLSVRLECGRPSDPLLLAGFVGDGSEDRPFALASGEEREFLLGISAQDVTTADHRIPVRIVSANGLADEAEVSVHVQLPRIDLEWQDMGASDAGTARTLLLINHGDAVTDLAVAAEQKDLLLISPTVSHGLLPAGASMQFRVEPRLYEGFTGVKTNLIARTLDKTFAQPYAMQLEPGQSVRRIWLFPGIDPAGEEAKSLEPELITRAKQAEGLDPRTVDWPGGDAGEDLDGDGNPDRWSQLVGEVRWVGDDTDHDRTIDFVHADVGDDGIFEYSAIREGEQWRSTNLVEAWLEMGFTLPWNRGEYKPHDADILLNDTVIGRLRDTIPDGNYSFPIPSAALLFDDNGLPGDNRVGIASNHLRGGHYVVNSDFRFKFRLTATPIWTVARSEEEARAAAAKTGGISLDDADLSISSAELRLSSQGEVKAGDEVVLEAAVHNLGGVPAWFATFALFRQYPDGRRQELTRTVVDHVPLHGDTPLRLSWKAGGGANTLVLVADPDQKLKDADRGNNEAVAFLQVSGDDRPPSLKIVNPAADGQTAPSPLVRLEMEAEDDLDLAGISLTIDGGLRRELDPSPGKKTLDLLLQPGSHRIELRAEDGGGNVVTQTRTLQVSGNPPVVRFETPAEGAQVATRIVAVTVAVPAGTALAGARVSGGPWRRAAMDKDRARVEVPLRFGHNEIEVMVADGNGIAAISRRTVECVRQPLPDDPPDAAATEHGLLRLAGRLGFGIDLFQQLNGPLEPVPAEEQVAAADARGTQEGGKDRLAEINRATEELKKRYAAADEQTRKGLLTEFIRLKKEKSALLREKSKLINN